MTYSIINSVFLLAAAVLLVLGLRLRGARRMSRAALLITAVLMIILTIVFDNLMIAVGFVVYGAEQASGLMIGRMPVEDLAYTVFAVAALPALWELLGGRRRRGHAADERLGGSDGGDGPDGSDAPGGPGGHVTGSGDSGTPADGGHHVP